MPNGFRNPCTAVTVDDHYDGVPGTDPESDFGYPVSTFPTRVLSPDGVPSD